MSHALRLIEDLESSMNTFDGTAPIIILRFLSRFVEECGLEHISVAHAYLMMQRVLRDIRLDSFLVARSVSSYTGLLK